MDCELICSELKAIELTGTENDTELAENDARERELATKELSCWELACEESEAELNCEVCASISAAAPEGRPLVRTVISTPESTATIPRTAMKCLCVCIEILYQKSPFLTILSVWET